MKKNFFFHIYNLIIIFFSLILLFQYDNYVSRDLSQYYFYFTEIIRVQNLGLNFNHFYYAYVHCPTCSNVTGWQYAYPPRFEIGSAFLFWQFLYFFSYFNTFYIIGSISLIIKFYLFNKYLYYSRLAFLIYLFVFAWNYDASQLIQAIALNFIFYLLLTKKNYLTKDTLIIFIGSLFHSTAIIFLYFHSYIILKYLKLKSSISFILAFIAITFITLISYYLILGNNIFNLMYYLTPGQVNIFSYLFLIQFSFILFLLFNFGNMDYAQRKGLLFLCIGVVIYFVFNEYSAIASRFKEISLIGAIPVLFSKQQKITFSWVGAYILFTGICAYYIFLLSEMFVNIPFLDNLNYFETRGLI